MMIPPPLCLLFCLRVSIDLVCGEHAKCAADWTTENVSSYEMEK